MKKLTKTDYLRVGNSLASIWGGSCYDFKVNEENKEVEFFCIENGEDFVTSLSFEEVMKEVG